MVMVKVRPCVTIISVGMVGSCVGAVTTISSTMMSAFWGFPSSLTPSQSRALADLRSRWRRMSQPLDPDDPFWEVLVRPEGLSLPPPDGEAVDAAAAQADADWHLLRFLRARDFNVDKALVKMDQAARERERRGMKAWHDPGTARRIMLEPGAGVYACTTPLRDRRGRPLSVGRFAACFGPEMQYDEHLTAMMVFAEQMATAVLRPVAGCVYLLDFEKKGGKYEGGAPMKNGLRCVKEAIGITSLVYPETLSKVYFLNAPWTFRAIWALICVVLDRRQKDKVCFLRSAADLQKDFTDDNILRCYGGEATLGGAVTEEVLSLDEWILEGPQRLHAKLEADAVERRRRKEEWRAWRERRERQTRQLRPNKEVAGEGAVPATRLVGGNRKAQMVLERLEGWGASAGDGDAAAAIVVHRCLAKVTANLRCDLLTGPRKIDKVEGALITRWLARNVVEHDGEAADIIGGWLVQCRYIVPSKTTAKRLENNNKTKRRLGKGGLASFSSAPSHRYHILLATQVMAASGNVLPPSLGRLIAANGAHEPVGAASGSSAATSTGEPLCAATNSDLILERTFMGSDQLLMQIYGKKGAFPRLDRREVRPRLDQRNRREVRPRLDQRNWRVVLDFTCLALLIAVVAVVVHMFFWQ